MHSGLQNGKKICEEQEGSTTSSTDSIPKFYIFHCIVGSKEGKLWVGVSILDAKEEAHLYREFEVERQEIDFHKLSQNIQGVGVVHACQVEKKCRLRHGNFIENSTEITEGGYFYIFGRLDGYPPRMGK